MTESVLLNPHDWANMRDGITGQILVEIRRFRHCGNLANGGSGARRPRGNDPHPGQHPSWSARTISGSVGALVQAADGYLSLGTGPDSTASPILQTDRREVAPSLRPAEPRILRPGFPVERQVVGVLPEA